MAAAELGDANGHRATRRNVPLDCWLMEGQIRGIRGQSALLFFFFQQSWHQGGRSAPGLYDVGWTRLSVAVPCRGWGGGGRPWRAIKTPPEIPPAAEKKQKKKTFLGRAFGNPAGPRGRQKGSLPSAPREAEGAGERGEDRVKANDNREPRMDCASPNRLRQSARRRAPHGPCCRIFTQPAAVQQRAGRIFFFFSSRF